MKRRSRLIVSALLVGWLLAGCAGRNPLPATATGHPGIINAAGPGTSDVAEPNNTYDAALVAAIDRQWETLLASKKFAVDRIGMVVVRFQLHQNGTVSHLTILTNTVGPVLGYISLQAIKESAPFAPWPADNVRMVGADKREIVFNFYLNRKVK